MAVVAVAVGVGLAVFGPSTASDAKSNPRVEALAAPSCTDDCNRKASECLDECEEKFKNDDKSRVTCKFECSNKRQQCEKGCS
jgi:hypothetical protein